MFKYVGAGTHREALPKSIGWCSNEVLLILSFWPSGVVSVGKVGCGLGRKDNEGLLAHCTPLYKPHREYITADLENKAQAGEIGGNR